MADLAQETVRFTAISGGSIIHVGIFPELLNISQWDRLIVILDDQGQDQRVHFLRGTVHKLRSIKNK
jgi:hypothetical protein